MSNNILKIMSVFIAVSLWVMVVSGQVQTVNITVPVKLTNAPKDYVAVSDLHNITVTVKGSAKLITNMDYGSVILEIDVAAFPIGDSIRRIIPSDFKTPFGLEVTEVSPNTINITIDRVGFKQVRVVPNFIGEVSKGFKVEAASTKPHTVVVEGARSKIEHIDSIATLPINISGLDNNAVFNIGFRKDEGIHSVKPLQVDVDVKVRPNIVRRDFENVEVSCVGLGHGFVVKKMPRLQSVKVEGRLDIVEAFLDTSKFVVNCSAVNKAGVYSGLVSYQNSAEGAEVISIFPQKITFEIGKR